MELKELINSLRALRKKRNLTQQQLADKVGLSSRTILKYEMGTASPTLDTCGRLATALDSRLEIRLAEHAAA